MTKEKEDAFRFLNSILTGKEPIVKTEDDEKAYKKLAFLTNRGLSQHADTIMYANVINMYPNLSPKMQYDYLFHSIEKRKRPYKSWAKAPNNEKIKLVQEKYEYNEKKARALLILCEKYGIEIKKEETL